MLEPVAVYWLDAAGHRHDEDLQPIPTVTFGIIVEVTEEFVRLAAESGGPASDREDSDFTVIPRGMVLAIKHLTKVQPPVAVYEYVRDKKHRKRAK